MSEGQFVGNNSILACIFLAAFCIFLHTQYDRRYMMIYKDIKQVLSENVKKE